MRLNVHTTANWITATALLIVLALTACASDGGGEGAVADGTEGTPAAAGDTEISEITVALPAEPLGFDNFIDIGNPQADFVGTNVNEPLVRWTPENELAPFLASALPQQLEDDPNRWRVELRDDVSFTNGEPFNAETVAANLERLLEDPEVQAESQIPAVLETVESVEIVDEYTVEFVTSAPDPVFDRRLSYFYLGPPEAMGSEEYRQQPVGTGPYMVESRVRGSQITLVANPDYWGEQPKIDTVVVRFIPEEATRLAALETGEVDMAADMPPDRIEELPQAVQSTGFPESEVIRLNIANGPDVMADPNFRRALNYAVDKQQIVDAVFGGAYRPSQCQVWDEGVVGYNLDLESYPYDPARAEELLSQVDMPEDLTLEMSPLSVPVPTRLREAMQSVEGYLSDVGVNVEIRIPTDTERIDILLKKESEPVELFVLSPDNAWGGAMKQVQNYYHSEGVYSQVAGYPEVDAMIDEAATATDPQTREDLIREINRIACEEAFLLFFYDIRNVWGASEAIQYEHQSVGDLYQMQLWRLQ